MCILGHTDADARNLSMTSSKFSTRIHVVFFEALDMFHVRFRAISNRGVCRVWTTSEILVSDFRVPEDLHWPSHRCLLHAKKYISPRVLGHLALVKDIENSSWNFSLPFWAAVARVRSTEASSRDRAKQPRFVFHKDRWIDVNLLTCFKEDVPRVMPLGGSRTVAGKSWSRWCWQVYRFVLRKDLNLASSNLARPLRNENIERELKERGRQWRPRHHRLWKECFATSAFRSLSQY